MGDLIHFAGGEGEGGHHGGFCSRWGCRWTHFDRTGLQVEVEREAIMEDASDAVLVDLSRIRSV